MALAKVCNCFHEAEGSFIPLSTNFSPPSDISCENGTLNLARLDLGHCTAHQRQQLVKKTNRRSSRKKNAQNNNFMCKAIMVKSSVLWSAYLSLTLRVELNSCWWAEGASRLDSCNLLERNFHCWVVNHPVLPSYQGLVIARRLLWRCWQLYFSDSCKGAVNQACPAWRHAALTPQKFVDLMPKKLVDTENFGYSDTGYSGNRIEWQFWVPKRTFSYLKSSDAVTIGYNDILPLLTSVTVI